MVGPPNGPPGQSSESLRKFGLVKGSKHGKGMSLESKTTVPSILYSDDH